jgi:lactoylglutathione lyase
MKYQLYHSCITVLDLEKSMEFYKEALGFTEVRRIEGEDGSFRIVFMGNLGDETRLELTWYRDRKEPYDLGDNEIHVGFRVDNFQEAYQKHQEMGIICYENQDMGIYFIQDPDGYWMEIVPTR